MIGDLMNRPVAARFLAGSVGGVLAALVLSCAPEPTSSDIGAPTAWLTNGKSHISASSSTSYDMTVSATVPDSATQDTTLDVTISGSGFVSGTSATWALIGVADPSQVKTNRTTYVSSRKIIANITISATATIAKWDVVVTAAGKKGGIGSEAFAIKAKKVPTDTKPNLVWDENVNVAPTGQPAVWQPALITGDFRKRDGSPVTDGSSGEFQFNFCGSDGFMQNNQLVYPQAALNFDPDHFYDPATMDAACGGKRYYQFFFSGRSAAPLKAGPQHYALHLSDLAVGQTLIEEVHFGIQQTNCSALNFNDIYPPASNARVTRLTDTVSAGVVERRWRVESQGSHRAMCTLFSNKGPKPTGVTYYLPFAFTITEVHYPFAAFP
jgi:hypothetical protein